MQEVRENALLGIALGTLMAGVGLGRAALCWVLWGCCSELTQWDFHRLWVLVFP